MLLTTSNHKYVLHKNVQNMKPSLYPGFRRVCGTPSLTAWSMLTWWFASCLTRYGLLTYREIRHSHAGLNQRNNIQFVRPSEMMSSPTKDGKLCNIIMHNIIWYWIFFNYLATHTCNVWRSMLSRICRRIGRHLKCSVDTLIVCFYTLDILSILNMFKKSTIS